MSDGFAFFCKNIEKFLFTLYGSYNFEQKESVVILFVLMWFHSTTALGVFFKETT